MSVLNHPEETHAVQRRLTPERHDQNHVLQSSTHLSQATLCQEARVVAESSLFLCAEVFGDLVRGRDAGNISVRILDDLAVLDVDAADSAQVTSVGAISSDKLRDNSENRVGIDGLAGAVEAGIAQAIGVEVASIGVADAVVAGVVAVGAAAFRSRASSLTS